MMGNIDLFEIKITSTASSPGTRVHVFRHLKKEFTPPLLYLVYLHTGSGIGLYLNYIQSITTHVIPMERALQDDLNHTMYPESPDIDLHRYRNKATICLLVCFDDI